MPIVSDASVVLTLSWSQTDTEQGLARVSSVGAVGIDQYLPMGVESGQINEVWHDINTLTPAQTIDLDLTNLSLQLFNDIVIVSFSLVRAIAIKNNNIVSGEVISIAAPANGLTLPFGAGPIPIMPGGQMIFTNFFDNSWVVDDTHKILSIIDSGAGATYEVGIVGIK